VLRFHIGPSIAVVALFIAGREVRSRWTPLVLGGAVIVVGSGLLDAATWSTPFQSIWLNFYVNVIDHVGATFGVQPAYEFVRSLGAYWSGAFLLIIATALVGARRLPMALAAVMAIIFTMSMIDHKEYRFIYPALVLVPILLGLGTAEAAVFLRDTLNLRLGFVVAAACAFWIGTSSLLAVAGAYRPLWFNDVGVVRAFRAASHLSGVCGVGLRGIEWYETPGQSGLPREVKLYGTISDDRFAASQAGFNVVVGLRDSPPNDVNYEQLTCWSNGVNPMGTPSLPEICIWRRPGSCQLGVAPEEDTPWPRPLRARYSGTCPDGPFCRKDHAGLK
jgi:phosphatidylinositol glycan class B